MKQYLVSALRRVHLLTFADRIKFVSSYFHYLKTNRAFLREHRGVVLPPAYILFESFGKMDYPSYYTESRDSAEYYISLMAKHIDLKNARICEWGCGPARLLRHFADILGDREPELFGTDYNLRTIAWCKEKIPGIRFASNRLLPPLEYPDDYFDVVYCVSVFTHLSQEAQKLWLDECMRVIKPGGIFLMTVHGDTCSRKLLPDEADEYRGTGCVIRGRVKEGKRVFTAYNSPDYMRNVFLDGLRVEEHIEGRGTLQDIWIVRKQDSRACIKFR
jgi:SAM-dependent methyltransferase